MIYELYQASNLGQDPCRATQMIAEDPMLASFFPLDDSQP